LGRPVGYGYVRHAAGVDEAYLTSGAYALVVAGETHPATLSLRPMVDPDNLRVKA